MPEIRSDSLTSAWLAAIRFASEQPRREVCPLTVVVDTPNGVLREEMAVRQRLDRLLDGRNLSVETVAATIFPQSLWNPAKPRSELFRRYSALVKRIRSFPQNHRGVYFQRMIDYPVDGESASVNQIEHVISTYENGNHRRSALQLGIFSPRVDHTNSRQLGFPCLQQVTFAPQTIHDSLCVTGFYAFQYLFARAYGNYLGLARLGRFVAHELQMKLGRVVCVAAVAKLEVPAAHLKSILEPEPRIGD